MRNNCNALKQSEWVLAVVLAAGLGACGSDSGPVPPPGATISLSAANRDTVSHATATGMMAISPVDAIPLGVGASSTGRQSAQAVAGATPQGWLGHLVAYALPAARQTLQSAGRSHTLAMSAPIQEACTMSDTMAVTLDDRDDSQTLTGGDVLTITFDNCKESTFDTLHGTATATFTQVGTTSFNARMVFAQMLDATENHSVTLSGAALLAYSQPGTLEITRMTADGSLVAAVRTHLFDDTVTLLDGFVSEATYDAAAAPPPGSTTPGRTLSTAVGSLESTAAGGIVAVSTDESAPITSYDADAYPRAGVVRVKGTSGTLLLTGLTASTVRLDLDTNDDGGFESSEVKTWDWLL
jgi:hypothetical protein